MPDLNQLDALQQVYRDDIDALRTASDTKFGILSKRVQTSDGDMWVRDATKAYALDALERSSHDDPAIESYNTLLRMLTRLRPIDYMLSKQDALDENMQKRLRDELKQRFEQAKVNILALDQELPRSEFKKKMYKIEAEFSTDLIERLHEANLTQGCSTKKDAEALIAHYKILYSVLDPAMPLVTLTYDEGTKILQRETQYPVTEKTEFQKLYVNTLKTVTPHPLGGEINAHTVKNKAKQQADACFADLLVADDRMLTSQARKSHVVGVKNAFIVNVETLQLGFEDQTLQKAQAQPEAPLGDSTPLWLGRMGVPVYVGPGEKDTNAHVKANLEQLAMAAQKHMNKENLAIHLTTLNTYTNMDGEKQDVMIDGLRQAMKAPSFQVSVVPTNDIGMLYIPELAESIQRKGQVQPGKKADRLDFAVDVTLEANKQPRTISFVNCASGIDRTGTVIEAVIQRHTAKKMKINDASVFEAMRARGFNSAEFTHHMVPGTPGMKPCSKANNWFGWGRKTFSDLAGREFYLKTAQLNKKNKITKIDCFKKPSEPLREAFETNKARLDSLLKQEQNNQDSLFSDMREAAQTLLKHAKDEPMFKAKDYEQLCDVYALVIEILEKTQQSSLDEARLNEVGLALKRLDKLQKTIRGEHTRAHWIGRFVATVIAGVVSAILLTVPWFNAVFLVAGLLVVASSMKIGLSLGLCGDLAVKVLFLFPFGPAKDYLLADDLQNKTCAFTEAGQTFFHEYKKKNQTEHHHVKQEDSGEQSDEAPKPS